MASREDRVVDSREMDARRNQDSGPSHRDCAPAEGQRDIRGRGPPLERRPEAWRKPIQTRPNVRWEAVSQQLGNANLSTPTPVPTQRDHNVEAQGQRRVSGATVQTGDPLDGSGVQPSANINADLSYASVVRVTLEENKEQIMGNTSSIN